MAVKNIIFDVDGTIWDSAKAVADSWTEVFSTYPETAGKKLTADDMYRLMGHTMDEIEMAVFPDMEPSRRREIIERCEAYENEYLYGHSGDFYPDVKETMGKLREAGVRLFIVSNSQSGYIEAMLSCGGLEEMVEDHLCFGDTGKIKGENILLLMKENGLMTLETVYVGDTIMDEDAADYAGISFIHAAYGFGKARHPKKVLERFADLPKLASSI